MLPRIVLFALQLLAAWYVGEALTGFIARGFSIGRANEIFLYAGVYPLIVMLVGYAGSKVMKDVPTPSGGTLAATFALAIGLAVLSQVALVTQMIEAVIPVLRGNRYLYPLVGAIVGYFAKR